MPTGVFGSVCFFELPANQVAVQGASERKKHGRLAM